MFQKNQVSQELDEELNGFLEMAAEDKIAEAMRLLFELANLKAGPTGALALAAVLSEPQLFNDRPVCCVVSGENVCTSFYRTILDAS